MENKWISVNNYLPITGKRVLIYASSGYMEVKYLHVVEGTLSGGGMSKGFYWYPDGLPLENTTHWMELPEEPK